MTSRTNEMADLVEDILKADGIFAVLGFSKDQSPIAPAVIRSAFRKRALGVHPDKSSHERAPQAFLILSEAFEALHDPREQARRRSSESAQSRASKPPSKRRRTAPPSRTRSWKEWEQDLRRYEELERCFQSMQRSKYADRKATLALRRAAQICTELDERARIPGNELLLSNTQGNAKAAGTGAAVCSRRRRFTESGPS